MKKSALCFLIIIAWLVLLSNPIIAAPPQKTTGTQPFQIELNHYNWQSDQTGHWEVFTVPSDKRLVIEFVSGNAGINGPQEDIGHIILFEVWTTVNDTFAKHKFVLTPQGPAGGLRQSYTVSQDTTIYADPGTDVTVYINHNVLVPEGFFNASISGRLESVE